MQAFRLNSRSQFWSGSLITHQATRISWHLVIHGDQLAGQYFFAVLRERNVSAFCNQFYWRAAARTFIQWISYRRHISAIFKIAADICRPQNQDKCMACTSNIRLTWEMNAVITGIARSLAASPEILSLFIRRSADQSGAPVLNLGRWRHQIWSRRWFIFMLLAQSWHHWRPHGRVRACHNSKLWNVQLHVFF